MTRSDRTVWKICERRGTRVSKVSKMATHGYVSLKRAADVAFFIQQSTVPFSRSVWIKGIYRSLCTLFSSGNATLLGDVSVTFLFPEQLLWLRVSDVKQKIENGTVFRERREGLREMRTRDT